MYLHSGKAGVRIGLTRTEQPRPPPQTPLLQLLQLGPWCQLCPRFRRVHPWPSWAALSQRTAVGGCWQDPCSPQSRTCSPAHYSRRRQARRRGGREGRSQSSFGRCPSTGLIMIPKKKSSVGRPSEGSPASANSTRRATFNSRSSIWCVDLTYIHTYIFIRLFSMVEVN